jgi:hypothetical protein
MGEGCVELKRFPLHQSRIPPMKRRHCLIIRYRLLIAFLYGQVAISPSWETVFNNLDLGATPGDDKAGTGAVNGALSVCA